MHVKKVKPIETRRKNDFNINTFKENLKSKAFAIITKTKLA